MADSSIAPVWILTGPEVGLKEAFVADQIAKVRASGEGEPEIHRFYAGDCAISDALMLLRNSSLFSPWTIVELRNIDQLGQKTDIETLAAYCKTPAENALLFLETETYSVPSVLEKTVPPSCRKTFFELFESELMGWVRRELSASGLSIDDNAIESLLELVPHDTPSLKAACLILTSSFPDGTRLQSEDVEAAILRSRPEDAFSLFDRIAQGDLETALEVLDVVLDSRRGDANQIIAALVWSFRRLQRLGEAIAKGERFEDACLREQARSKTVQRQLRAALGRYSVKDCRRIIVALSETEAALRSPLGNNFSRQLLHLLITSIITEKGRGIASAGWSAQSHYPNLML
ncbi:MAG: DNA polymerase III subunit delta [Rectinema sp.]|nr:DNA polymerase III subunit delta [Rectinema sp.]